MYDTRQKIAAIRASPTYRLAEDDVEFMESEAARASRLALEFRRVDVYLKEQRINSTVVVFGSSREPAGSRHYQEARALASALTRHDARNNCHDFVIATGGGPGIMEAANRGAAEIAVPTIGFNIRLPTEQDPNPYLTPKLAFQFHYFGMRKMHFLLRARALIAFPGGFGTLDEVFEALNLVQTRMIRPIPIVLVGAEHWSSTVDFEYLATAGFIDPADRELFSIVETGAEAARRIIDFYNGACAAGRLGDEFREH